MKIPRYPEYADLNYGMKDELAPALWKANDGISEITFANLYLFRDTYRYRVTKLEDDTYIFSGRKGGDRFIIIPGCLPSQQIIDELFKDHDYIKCFTDECSDRIKIEQWGYCALQDRCNFDYLYLREDLAKLAGKKYHKKRNLVNAFLNNYNYCETKMDENNIRDAFTVLEKWRNAREDDGDYKAASEALEKQHELGLSGCVYYVENEPAGFVLGEPLQQGKSFAIHFEKALDDYKGIYQFINRSFASILPKKYIYINREQDLGDPGLRQAKMTYRPYGFVKKCRVYKCEAAPFPQHFPQKQTAETVQG